MTLSFSDLLDYHRLVHQRILETFETVSDAGTGHSGDFLGIYADAD